jgi:hypothetical protein
VPFYISDTAYGSSWNGIINRSATKNAIYDYLHQIDTDDDGDADNIEPTSIELNDITDPSATVDFDFGAGEELLLTFNDESSTTHFKLESDALKTDTDVVFFWIEVDSDGSAVDVIKIVGGTTRPVQTGDLQLNTDSTNYSSIDKYMVNAEHINDLDDVAWVGKSTYVSSTAATYDIVADGGYTACGGRWFVNGDADAIEFTLPAATQGDVCCFADDSGGIISVNPDDATDFIVVDGTSYGAGDELDLSSGDGNFVCLQAKDGDEWIARGRIGTLSDGGAA